MTIKNQKLKKKHIVVFVELIPKQAIETVRENLPWCKILLLRDLKHRNVDAKRDFEVDFIEHIDFTSPNKIAQTLLPYQDNLLLITARGESGASRDDGPQRRDRSTP